MVSSVTCIIAFADKKIRHSCHSFAYAAEELSGIAPSVSLCTY